MSGTNNYNIFMKIIKLHFSVIHRIHNIFYTLLLRPHAIRGKNR